MEAWQDGEIQQVEMAFPELIDDEADDASIMFKYHAVTFTVLAKVVELVGIPGAFGIGFFNFHNARYIAANHPTEVI